MATATIQPSDPAIDRKPMMTGRSILLMNFGFFGVQYSFGMQQSAVNPVFDFLHADPGSLPLLNLAGPICGLLIQPMIGAWSDRTWSDRWGRRKPFFLIGAIGCSLGLFLFPFVTALWMAVLLLWLLDASNNTAMEPYRAFLADKLPDNQLARGFLTQSFFTGVGITLANLSLFFFQKILSGTTSAGIPYWVFGSFMLGAVCSIGSILVTTLSTPEIPPSAEERAELERRRASGGAGAMVKEIASAVRDMPASLHKLGLVYMFQWYAIVIYWQFVALSIAKSVYGSSDPTGSVLNKAVGMVGLVNGWYNIITFSVAFLLVGFAHKYGAKWVHSGCLVLAALGLIAFSQVHTTALLFIPIVGLGIAWASMMGVPYIMVVSMVPKERYGVYMGIINMMIVVPMLIQGVTFGWIYNHLLGADPTHAIMFAGVLFACAAVAMTWIQAPKKQSQIIPLTYRRIMGYDKVLVGSDGSDSSLRAVERAAEVAGASQAGLVIACAYSPMGGRDQAVLNATLGDARQTVRGEDGARKAFEESLARVNQERVPGIEQMLVEGEPAQAILDAAQSSGADLIIVGNRGLDALSGTLLGSVPGDIARGAPCDVLIVQTTPESAMDAMDAADRASGRR